MGKVAHKIFQVRNLFRNEMLNDQSVKLECQQAMSYAVNNDCYHFEMFGFFRSRLEMNDLQRNLKSIKCLLLRI